MNRLPFTLPRWSELVWADAELRQRWAPVFAAAPLALAERWIDAVAQGVLPIVLVNAKPFQIPQLMRRAREGGCQTQVIDGQSMRLSTLISGHDGVSPILAIGTSDALQRLSGALVSGNMSSLLDAAEWPSCCAKSWIEGGFTDPVWSFVLAGSQEEGASRENVSGEQYIGIPFLRGLE